MKQLPVEPLQRYGLQATPAGFEHCASEQVARGTEKRSESMQAAGLHSKSGSVPAVTGSHQPLFCPVFDLRHAVQVESQPDSQQPSAFTAGTLRVETTGLTIRSLSVHVLPPPRRLR